MALKWKNPQQLDRYIRQAEQACRQAARETLAELGERMLTDARNDVGKVRCFTDRTGNLRSSIGYVVVQQGQIVSEACGAPVVASAGYEAGSRPAQVQAESLAHAGAVASTLDKEKTWLVFVAGMDYASHVEARGFDVVTGTFDRYSSSEELKALGVRFVGDVREAMSASEDRA